MLITLLWVGFIEIHEFLRFLRVEDDFATLVQIGGKRTLVQMGLKSLSNMISR